MKTPTLRRRVATLGFLGLTLTASLASPQTDDGARRAFEEGVVLEKKNDYAGALQKFRDSAAIKPTLGNRFHMAFCLEMTGRLATALEEYEAVEKAASAGQKADVVTATRARLEPLRAKVPQLTVRLAAGGPAPADVTLLLDDAPLPPAALERSTRIDPGEHVVVAQAPGYQVVRKPLTVVEGTSPTLDLVFEPNPTAPPAPEARPSASTPAPPTSRTGLAIAAAGGAALLAGGGLAAFLVAGSKQEDAEAGCLARVSCEREQTGVRTFDTLALAGFVGGAGLAALSIVLFATGPRATVSAHGSRLVFEGRF